MSTHSNPSALAAACVALAVVFSGTARAAPGDVHRVAGADVVNLRAGPDDDSNIRGRVEQGDEVIELTSEGNWLGVRVLQTGEEGWIFGGLLERVAQSGLLPGDAGFGDDGDGGFLQLSEGFDRLIRRIDRGAGYRMVQEAVPVGDGVLRVTPTAAWLRAASRESHLMAALAFYQMWKNHQNGRPVTMVMPDDRGEDYIQIADGDRGPELAIAAP
jgi:Bacterial SH3 domain